MMDEQLTRDVSPAGLQRQATWVTVSDDDEGCANAIEQFILPRAAAD